MHLSLAIMVPGMASHIITVQGHFFSLFTAKGTLMHASMAPQARML
jgi:hypothetical protein